MGRIRLNKAERVAQAGKGNNKAQYRWGGTKRKGKEFGSGTVSTDGVPTPITKHLR